MNLYRAEATGFAYAGLIQPVPYVLRCPIDAPKPFDMPFQMLRHVVMPFAPTQF
jgi:hypothetical protein